MKKLLILLLAVGILAAGVITIQNDAAEWNMRDVEIAVDFDDVLTLARDANRTPEDMLVQLKTLGVTAVGVREAAVLRYRREGSISPVPGSDIIHNWRLTGEAHAALVPLLENGAVQPNTTYLLLEDQSLADRLVAKARLKLQKPVRTHFDQMPLIVEIDEDLSKVIGLRIGVEPRDTAMLQALGLRMVPRPDNLNLQSEEAVRETLDEFFSLPAEMLSAVIFEGTEVTGFPKHLEITAASLKKASLPFGIIEFFSRQAGIDRLSALTGYNTLLVHPNQPGKPVQSIANSVRERRVRVVYLRFPLTEPGAVSKSFDLVRGVSDTLAMHNYSGGLARTTTFPPYGPALFLLLILAVAAAATLLLIEVLHGQPCPLWLLFAAAFAGLMALFPVLSTNTALQAVSLLAVVIFASLAVVSQQFNRIPDKANNTSALLWAITTMLRTFLIIAAGGLIIVSLTSSPYFTGGTALFRGVKAVHILPFLLFFPLAVIRIFYHNIEQWTPSRLVRAANDLLSRPVLVSYIILFTVLAVAAVFYVGRTGHTAGLPVPALELRIRDLLERFLVVRPRFKEFLIGYPLALLGLTQLARGSRSAITTALLVLGAVAPVSMANTFMHFTTPIPYYNALLRSFNGLWTGVIIGAVLYAALLILNSLWENVVKDS
ncbi:MAG: hypothetical protein KGZ63_02525 [Clostridiales bacterium]|jgi:hypothetical protein|nr:hypothetical protein [Clostridiales bacterium]